MSSCPPATKAQDPEKHIFIILTLDERHSVKRKTFHFRVLTYRSVKIMLGKWIPEGHLTV